MLVNDAAAHTLATCPAGYTLIFKDVHVYNANSASQTESVVLVRPNGVTVAVLNGSVQPNTSTSWQGWMVLEAGDRILISASAGPMYYWASGTVLVGEAPPT